MNLRPLICDNKFRQIHFCPSPNRSNQNQVAGQTDTGACQGQGRGNIAPVQVDTESQPKDNPVKTCRCQGNGVCGCPGIKKGPDGKWYWPGQKPAKFSEVAGKCHRLLTPTIVLGHEEAEDEAKFWAELSTGIPDVGIVTNLWREGRFLVGDFGDLQTFVEKAINAKGYRKVSAEIYDNFEDQGQSYGMALRRVALLGGEQPQVKSLADMPMSDELGSVRGVEIFAAGVHPTQNGPKEYTVADLDTIVGNFNRLSTCAPAKMSERKSQVLYVFHELRRRPKVFKGPDGRWYWPQKSA